MSEADIQQWRAIALAIPKEQIKSIGVPKAILQKEAIDIVPHIKDHWDPDDGTPKLKQNGGRFTLSIADELQSLSRASREADALWILIIDPKSPEGLVERGGEVLRELIIICGFLLDDGVYEPADDQYARMRAEHARDGRTIAELARALYNFHKLAETLRSRIIDLEGEAAGALIDEALALADALVALPSSPPPPSPESIAALDLRNRLFTLLDERLTLVRSTAAFKFRHHPEIAKKFISTYERRRRRALARRKEREAQEKERSEKEKALQKEYQRLLEEAKEQLRREKILEEARRALEEEEKK